MTRRVNGTCFYLKRHGYSEKLRCGGATRALSLMWQLGDAMKRMARLSPLSTRWWLAAPAGSACPATLDSRHGSENVCSRPLRHKQNLTHLAHMQPTYVLPEFLRPLQVHRAPSVWHIYCPPFCMKLFRSQLFGLIPQQQQLTQSSILRGCACK